MIGQRRGLRASMPPGWRSAPRGNRSRLIAFAAAALVALLLIYFVAGWLFGGGGCDLYCRAGDDIGSLIVTGSLIGNSNPDGDSPVIIAARGQHTVLPGATSDLAIGRIAIGGRVEFAIILAGYDTRLVPRNADAQIGAVTVGGDWIASTIVAGVVDGGNGFGNSLDAKIGLGTDTLGIVSKIASITIGGLALGTPSSISSTDSSNAGPSSECRRV